MCTAVILYGHYRTFDKVYAQWKNIEADFYFSTWDTVDSITKSWHKNDSPGICLNNQQKNILNIFDKNVSIKEQHFTTEEKQNILGGAPFKAKDYSWRSVIDSVNRIKESGKKYDKIIISRFDIVINSDIIKDITVIPINTIKIGGREDSRYYKNIAASDLLFCINYEDIDKINKIIDILESWNLNKKMFNYGEEPFTFLIFNNWQIIDHCWTYDTDFRIIR